MDTSKNAPEVSLKILLAPDSFKGSLSSAEFCQIAEQAIHSISDKIEVHKMPMADGGEGMVDSLFSLPNSKKINLRTTSPLGKPINCYYNYIETSQTAIIEMASASGLTLLNDFEQNAMQASTIGTGKMIQHAINKGTKNLILGLGGSATTDAGIGCLAKLGFKFLNAQGKSVSLDGAGLRQIKKIERPAKDYSFLNIQIASDVSNLLYGRKGAAYVFAPQKGASATEVRQLDEGLKNFAKIVKKDLKIDLSEIKGAGAGGGMGAGMLLLGAKPKSGFKIISDLMGFEKLFKQHDFDLVITGEGSLDEQSLNGKVPIEVAKVAKKYQVSALGIFGKIEMENEQAYQNGLQAMFSLTNQPMTIQQSQQQVKELLYRQVQNLIRLKI